MNRSLRDLEANQIYNIPLLEEASSIQRRIVKLYNTIIDDFSLGDIRFMIGQEIGLDYLVNIGLEHLKEDIFLETEYYEGDLLSIILQLPSDFWETHPTEKDKLLELLNINYNTSLEQDLSRKIKKMADNFVEKYSGIHKRRKPDRFLYQALCG